MGMYDYIICRMQLPGEPPTFIRDNSHQFQSKDLSCEIGTYEITEDGRLKQTGGMFGDVQHQYFDDFTGELNFYDSNCSASAHGIYFTPDGANYEWVTYTAIFVSGKVSEIVESERKREPALARSVLAECDRQFQNADEPEIDLSEPQVGDEMFLQYGGNIEGFAVKLVAKTSKKWAFTTEEDDIETLYPSDFGCLLFHSKEDSEAYNGARKDVNQQKTEYLQKLLAPSSASN